jgi:hypothetical protein
LFSHIYDMRTGGVSLWLISGDLYIIFKYVFGEIWVSWASPHHQGRRAECIAPFVLFSLHINDMRTGGVPHFLIFGEVSMSGQSVFGGFLVSWASRQHQGRRVECIAPFFFVSLVFVRILKISERQECLIFFRWGIHECSICFRWALSELSFLALWQKTFNWI